MAVDTGHTHTHAHTHTQTIFPKNDFFLSCLYRYCEHFWNLRTNDSNYRRRVVQQIASGSERYSSFLPSFFIRSFPPSPFMLFQPLDFHHIIMKMNKQKTKKKKKKKKTRKKKKKKKKKTTFMIIKYVMQQRWLLEPTQKFKIFVNRQNNYTATNSPIFTIFYWVNFTQTLLRHLK